MGAGCTKGAHRRKRLEREAREKLEVATEEEEQKLVADSAVEVDNLEDEQKQLNAEAEILESQLDEQRRVQQEARAAALEDLKTLRLQLQEQQTNNTALTTSVLDQQRNVTADNVTQLDDIQQHVVTSTEQAVEALDKAYRQSLSTHVQSVQDLVASQCQGIRASLAQVKKKIATEQATLESASRDLDAEKANLKTLLNQVQAQSQAAVQQKDKELITLREEINELKQKNEALTTQQEDAAQQIRRLKSKVAKRARRLEEAAASAIPAHPTTCLQWWQQTSANVKACCQSVGGPQDIAPAMDYDTSNQSAILSEHHHAPGTCRTLHDRSQCTVCRTLDMSDSSLFP